ncbi:MAG: carboxypeptidase regulatory-like domain-containing protein, partial [Planctomycetota bacterium]|nr:carboxypeptidase regulatory-like domain-containing protein [Planctomycetota bacterium]
YEEAMFDDETDSQVVRMPADDRQHELLFDLDGYDPAVRELPDLRGLTEPHVIDLEMTPAADAGESGTFYLEFEGETQPVRVAVVGRKDGDNHWKYWQRYPKADDKGRWAVNGVPVGDYRVVVLAPGSVPVTLERVSVTTTLKDTFRVRLSPGGGLSFSVQDGAGNLLDKVYLDLRLDGKGIDVQVYNRVSDGSAYVSVNYIPSAASASTDSGLAPGNYTITVMKEGYKPATKAFSITGTETAEVSFALQKAPS